jgi:glutathione synthase
MLIFSPLTDPTGYVLKPQREGGGNNLYGSALQTKLKTGGAEELRAFVLMQRLFPPRQPSIFIGRGRR